jgi:hypothetical protein
VQIVKIERHEALGDWRRGGRCGSGCGSSHDNAKRRFSGTGLDIESRDLTRFAIVEQAEITLVHAGDRVALGIAYDHAHHD